MPYIYGNAWKDQLTSIGGYGLTYDTNGNLLSYKTRSYTWQAGRQLAQITDNNLNAVYTYNESGIRTRKVVGGVTTDYVLDGGKVILETTGSDTLHYSYDSRGQLVSFSLNGTPYFYTRNGQGDITGLIDASGVEVVKYTYDSWGKPISITGSLALTVGAKNPYRYRGYRYDHESGLYYLQSRYYDPSIKRFISADIFVSTGQGFSGNNMFAYCGNNPVNRSDSGGMFWEKIYHFGKFMIELPMILQDNKINRRIHSENMVNLGIDSDATPKTFVGKYVKQDEGYEERCRSKYKTFISLQSNQDMIDKRWEEITLERQNLIIAQMITWDRDAHYKAFFINYSLHLIKLGYDVIY